MREKKYFLLSICLMLISGILLCLAVMYYDVSAKIKDYKYSNKDEYQNITEGLAFLKQMPIHFNIINKYFSDINNLSTKEKEEIVMAYAIKNNYALYECGPSSDIKKVLCISKKDLNSDELLSKFNLDMKFSSNEINIYIDDFGNSNISSSEEWDGDGLDYYKIIIEGKNDKYRLYSDFYEYKQIGDIYTFYLYQGYYNGNCILGDKLSLYDFMSGEEVYKNECNGNNSFVVDPGKNIERLQLYKYELKKDDDGKFYLYGYNPVNRYE